MRRQGIILGLLVVGCWLQVAQADDVVCGDATQLQRYLASVDPSRVTDPTCSVIPEAQTESQRTLVQSVARKYLKVVDGLAVEKDQAEKDQIDAAEAAQAAAQAQYQNEKQVNDFCNTLSMQTIDDRIQQLKDSIQVDIDNITNVATTKTAMTHLKNSALNAIAQLGRCVLASKQAR